MSNKAVNHLKYYSQLDGLRCFAVISVMIAHWIAWDTDVYLIKNIPWGHGVILFFVLSGYLISNILFELKEKLSIKELTLKQSLTTFYIRRIFRIFPAYYFLVFFLFYINYGRTREIFPWLVTYTTNILECKEIQYLGDFNHFWSLAVEEQFYLIWPFIILLVPQKNMLNTILFFIAGSLICRIICFFFVKNWMMTVFFTPNFFFPLCLGALMAYARRYHAKISGFFDSYLLLWFFVLFYAGFYYFHRFIFKIDFMKGVLDEYVFSIAAAFIIFRASQNKFKYLANFILTHDVVVYLGKISYGLYLFHLFIIALYWNYLAPRFQIDIYNKHTVWVFYFIIVFFIATFSYYTIEKPFNDLKKRFKY